MFEWDLTSPLNDKGFNFLEAAQIIRSKAGWLKWLPGFASFAERSGNTIVDKVRRDLCALGHPGEVEKKPPDECETCGASEASKKRLEYLEQEKINLEQKAEKDRHDAVAQA
jgi:hypothetical protein